MGNIDASSPCYASTLLAIATSHTTGRELGDSTLSTSWSWEIALFRRLRHPNISSSHLLARKSLGRFFLCVHLQDSFLVQRSLYIKSNPHGRHDHPFRRCPCLWVSNSLAGVAPSNGFPLEDISATKSTTPISINKKLMQ